VSEPCYYCGDPRLLQEEDEPCRECGEVTPGQLGASYAEEILAKIAIEFEKEE
jgi:hypothetical protein